MPQTKPYLQRSVSQRRAQDGRSADSGVRLTAEGIKEFLDACREKGLLDGTVEWYQRGLKRLYEELPEDKMIRYGNHSSSTVKGTRRGIHFQRGEKAQAKLVRCARGAVLDVAVDLRPSSPNYKRWVAVELSAENKRQLLIPRGFGHGFLTLTDDVEFLYKADNSYAPEADGGIRWNDPEIGVEWGMETPILSEKDSRSPFLKDAVTGFEEW